MTVPNHDWARVLAEPTTETIDHALQQTVRLPLEKGKTYKFDGEGFVLKLSPQQSAAIHLLIRRALAAELEKLMHSYNSRPGGLISPANVAYHLAEKVQELRSWRPSWNVVTTYEEDDGEDEQPFVYLNEALADAAFLLPGLTKKMRMR